MSIELTALLRDLDALLEPGKFQDYCPNGMQVQGRARIARIATAVTACQAAIDQALAWGADALLVHHGFFWRGEDPCVVGIKKRRLQALLAADVSLLAYHLPLDAHPELGNNAQLARCLGVVRYAEAQPGSLVCVGELAAPLALTDFCAQVAQQLQREPLLIDGAAAQNIVRVAWCSGAAQGSIEQAAAAGAQLYLSGEISEPTVHSARELGIHYLAAGHHATERLGVAALGEFLAQRYALSHQFFDVDNPV